MPDKSGNYKNLEVNAFKTAKNEQKNKIKQPQDKVEVKEVLVTCSGAMEKNIDVVIGRRFRKLGMSWTKEGRRFNNEVQHFRKRERKGYPKVLWERGMSI